MKAYRRADLFVLPTLNENFAMTVAEALAQGTPVISTKGAPWAELVSHGCGWWIDHGTEPLAAAMDEAMSIELGAACFNGRGWTCLDVPRFRLECNRHIDAVRVPLALWTRRASVLRRDGLGHAPRYDPASPQSPRQGRASVVARRMDATFQAITDAALLVAQVPAAKFWCRGRLGSTSLLVGSNLGALEPGYESRELPWFWRRLLLRRPSCSRP